MPQPSMHTAIGASDCAVTLPISVCEALGIEPGQVMHVVAHPNRLELIPARDPEQMRGTMRGMSTNLVREDDRL